MGLEEVGDPLACVVRRGLVVSAAHQAAEDGKQHAVVVVQEGVARLWIFVDVVRYLVVFQRDLELRRGPPERRSRAPKLLTMGQEPSRKVSASFGTCP
jgi:hypothetical protein